MSELNFRIVRTWYAQPLWRVAVWLLTLGELLMRIAIRKSAIVRLEKEGPKECSTTC